MEVAARIAAAATGAVLGLVSGSFLATLAVRWPKGESILTGRSHCDDCGRHLHAAELVPVLGFLWSRGRCRVCHGYIDRNHLMLEIGCALVGMLILGAAPGTDGLFLAMAGWLLLTLAIIDLNQFWLPDPLIIFLSIVGLLVGTGGLSPTRLDRFIGLAAGFAWLEITRVTYRRIRHIDGMGRGDPKLLAAIGACTGWAALPFIVFAAAIVGLGWAGTMAGAGAPLSRRTALPFGGFLALTTLAYIMFVSADPSADFVRELMSKR